MIAYGERVKNPDFLISFRHTLMNHNCRVTKEVTDSIGERAYAAWDLVKIDCEQTFFFAAVCRPNSRCNQERNQSSWPVYHPKPIVAGCGNSIGSKVNVPIACVCLMRQDSS